TPLSNCSICHINLFKKKIFFQRLRDCKESLPRVTSPSLRPRYPAQRICCRSYMGTGDFRASHSRPPTLQLLAHCGNIPMLKLLFRRRRRLEESSF
ncbi:hypothetical protein HWV62_2898, partial [Athelia sp. TMB]